MKVLIVDDSVTFRSAIKSALSGIQDIEIIGTAANGKIAISKIESELVDLMILDLEMPDMDGLETLEEMRKKAISLKILVFASPTESNYKKVSRALQLGASDFLAKPASSTPGSIEAAVESIRAELIPRVQSFFQKSYEQRLKAPQQVPSSDKQTVPVEWSRKELTFFMPSAVVIASSTGGPIALEALFSKITAPIKIPVFLVQHMPPPFTKGLAKRIEEITGLVCKEANDGEKVSQDRIYVAPANYHMSLTKFDGMVQLIVRTGEKINFVMPAADPLFISASKIYGKNLMAFVLTGMGEDGKEGARNVKQSGGGVMIQDEETSVVWGMPGSVHQIGAFDGIGPIEECSSMLKRMLS